MAETTQIGIIRHIDDLGRIVIPKEYRQALFGSRPWENEPMSMLLEKDANGKTILKICRYQNECHWIPHVSVHHNGTSVKYECSNCRAMNDKASNYCPECGTKMNNDNIRQETEKCIKMALDADQS